MSALALLLAVALVYAGMFWIGRWLAGVPFGARSFVQAVLPWRDDRRSLGFARAASGPIAWYAAAALVSTLGFWISGEAHPDESSMRVHVVAGGPAERAGLHDDDRVIAVDGQSIHSWDELRTSVATTERAHFEIERSGARHEYDVLPEGGKVRVTAPIDHVELGLGSALARGTVEPATFVYRQLYGWVRLMRGHKEPVTAMGPVGMVKETHRAESDGVGYALRIANLFFVYLLPVVIVLGLALAFAAHRSSAR